MQDSYLSLQQIKERDMVDYLKGLGFAPQRSRENDYWYLSPLHEEKIPSFKVNRQLNCWYDHSLGKGGNLVDFLLLLYNCTAKDLLQKKDSLSFHQPKSFHLLNETKEKNNLHLSVKKEDKSGIKILRETPIANSFLMSYRKTRSIPFEIANAYLKEVYYELHNKPYYALGFRNDSGGYELRNKYFKGSTSPKDVTTILSDNSTEEISVFEGFFSFLSYLSIQQQQNLTVTNFLVLNSISLFHRNMQKMDVYDKVHLYLDNDTAGSEITKKALQRSAKFDDKRHFYRDYKDFNEWLVHYNQRQKQSHSLKI